MSKYLLQGATGDWEIVIGLEVHAQITSESKLFSGAPTGFGAEPNANVSFIDAAMPGMLPVLNERCVYQAVKTGLALNAKINLFSRFDRKNYFYADLPQGYQISQYAEPIVGEGKLTVTLDDGAEKTFGIERLHIEQDAGKSMHDRLPSESLIDLNRAGVGLMEIVSKPDLRSPAEAAAYMKTLRAILRYIDTCDGDMEKGSLRCDANVSVRPEGATELRTRCEIKNLNSVRFLQQAIIYEAKRQIALYEKGGVPRQETRLFDPDKGETRAMRSKENAHDYRYFPEPDLPPLELTQDYVDAIKKTLPELPEARRARYVREWNVSESDAAILVADKVSSDMFERLCVTRSPKIASSWITAELFGRLNKRGLALENNPIDEAHFAELLELIETDVISGKIAKDVLDAMFETGKAPSVVVDENGWRQVSDASAVLPLVEAVMAENPEKVAEYRAGKDKLFGFFVGQVLKRSQGKANPPLVNALLKEKLGEAEGR
ncbi:MAG: Asp-tRNA(Asn)/Glu-tRNA(Gln) amidotransferase subunit GatB [Rickettsiales bacterium]